jgi:hypothetical protein
LIVVAIVRLHVLHHTLDPFGIVVAGLAVAVVLVLAGLVGARFVRRRADAVPPEPGTGTRPSAIDA